MSCRWRRVECVAYPLQLFADEIVDERALSARVVAKEDDRRRGEQLTAAGARAVAERFGHGIHVKLIVLHHLRAAVSVRRPTKPKTKKRRAPKPCRARSLTARPYWRARGCCWSLFRLHGQPRRPLCGFVLQTFASCRCTPSVRPPRATFALAQATLITNTTREPSRHRARTTRPDSASLRPAGLPSWAPGDGRRG